MEEKSPAEEGGGGGISPSTGPSSFLISIFPPFQFPPLTVETGSPRHSDGKAAVFVREAVRILNNCLLNKQTPRGRNRPPPLLCHPQHPVPPTAPALLGDTLPPRQNSTFTLATYIFSCILHPAVPQTQLRGPIAMLKGTSQQNVASFLEGPRKGKIAGGTLAGAGCRVPMSPALQVLPVCEDNAHSQGVCSASGLCLSAYPDKLSYGKGWGWDTALKFGALTGSERKGSGWRWLRQLHGWSQLLQTSSPLPGRVMWS